MKFRSFKLQRYSPPVVLMFERPVTISHGTDIGVRPAAELNPSNVIMSYMRHYSLVALA